MMSARQLLLGAALLGAALLHSPALAQPAQQAIVSSYIQVATTSKVFGGSDCTVLTSTIGTVLRSLTVWQYLNSTCSVTTGTSVPSVIQLTLNYNGTAANPWSGLVNNVNYLSTAGFQSFVGAIGPLCSSEALYSDTLNGQAPGKLLSACTADRTSGVTTILRPGFPCNQTLSQGTCPSASSPPPPSPPPPSPPPPTAPACLVVLSASRPAGAGNVYDPNCLNLISLTAPWFTGAGTTNSNSFCLDTGAYGPTISYAASVPASSVPALAGGFMANTITANAVITQVPLTCGGNITLMSNCSPFYRVITQATLPLAFSSPRQCTQPPVYG